jgi:hypothetical protein
LKAILRTERERGRGREGEMGRLGDVKSLLSISKKCKFDYKNQI